MSKIKELINRFAFESTAIVVFALSLVAGGINYIFQILSGRLFEPEFFGKISVLLSIIALFSALGSSLMKSMAVATASMNKNNIGELLTDVLKRIFLFIPIIFLAFSIFAYSRTHSVATAILFFVVCFLIVATFEAQGVLQGIGKIIPAQLCELIASLSRLIFLLPFLLLGFGYISAPLYYLIAEIIIFIFIIKMLRKENIKFAKSTLSIRPTTNKILKHYISSLISVVSLTIFNYLDIFSVQFFFNDYEVGQYSAVSLFGKIILYIPSALVLVMIPAVAGAETNKEKLQTLHKILFYSVGLSVVASAGLFIIKKPLITILMSEKYLPCLSLFTPVCLMMTALVIYTILINYELATQDKKFVIIFSILTVVISILTVLLFHKSISSCLMSIAFSYLMSSIILYARARLRHN